MPTIATPLRPRRRCRIDLAQEHEIARDADPDETTPSASQRTTRASYPVGDPAEVLSPRQHPQHP